MSARQVVSTVVDNTLLRMLGVATVTSRPVFDNQITDLADLKIGREFFRVCDGKRMRIVILGNPREDDDGGVWIKVRSNGRDEKVSAADLGLRAYGNGRWHRGAHLIPAQRRVGE